VPDQVKASFAIFDSAWMPKNTNYCSTLSGTGCFIAVPIWQQWTSKG